MAALRSKGCLGTLGTVLLLGVAGAQSDTFPPTAAPSAAPSAAPTAAPSSFGSPLVTSAFNITLIGDPEDPFLSYFERAAERWMQIVVGDVPDVAGGGTDVFLGALPGYAYSGFVDDMVVGYQTGYIDGAGKILGQTQVILVRRDTSPLPISAVMTFDRTDLAELEAANLLYDTILHEFGHALGFGSLWGATFFNCVSCANYASSSYYLTSPSDFVYDDTGSCPEAVREFEALGATVQLLVASSGGAETECSHWDEDQLQGELMTGYIENSAAAQKGISVITIGALADMGYEVDFGAADPFTLPKAATPAGLKAAPVPYSKAGDKLATTSKSVVQVKEDGTRFVRLTDDVLPARPLFMPRQPENWRHV